MEQIVGYSIRNQFEIVRAANTTAYAAGQAIRGASDIKFGNTSRVAGRSCYVTGGQILLKAAVSPGAVVFRLWLYAAAPAIADAAQVVLTYANHVNPATVAAMVGYVEFDTPSQGGTGSDFWVLPSKNTPIFIPANTSSRDLYGVLSPNGAWTPESLQKIMIQLNIDQN